MLTAQEGIDLILKSIIGEVAPYLQRIIEMGNAKPLNPIIIAPHIEVKVFLLI